MRKWKPLALGSALLFPLGWAAAQPARPTETLAQAERTTIEAVARDGLAAALHAALAPSGALLWPGAPVVLGPDQARQLLLAQPGLDSLQFSWQALGLATSRDGRLGITWGVAVAVSARRTTRFGRYIAAWQSVDSIWKLAAFVPLGLGPPTATVLPPAIAELRHAALRPAGKAAALVSADLAFARLAGDSGAALAFERFAAPEAFLLGGGLLTQGPIAIGRLIGAGPPSRWTWHPILAGAADEGDLGYTVGESVIRPEGGGAVNYGKYLTIWRRLPGGEIRFLTDGGNARPAPQ